MADLLFRVLHRRNAGSSAASLWLGGRCGRCGAARFRGSGRSPVGSARWFGYARWRHELPALLQVVGNEPVIEVDAVPFAGSL